MLNIGTCQPHTHTPTHTPISAKSHAEVQLSHTHTHTSSLLVPLTGRPNSSSEKNLNHGSFSKSISSASKSKLCSTERWEGDREMESIKEDCTDSQSMMGKQWERTTDQRFTHTHTHGWQKDSTSVNRFMLSMILDVKMNNLFNIYYSSMCSSFKVILASYESLI